MGRHQASFLRCLILPASLLLAMLLSAQVNYFDLSGTVSDSSGAVIPKAEVTLRNTDTGTSRMEITDERGVYHFISLPVTGHYTISVKMGGFATQERSGLIFEAASRPVIDFTLSVAQAGETVSIAADSPILEPQQSQLDLTVTEQKVQDMPLNGRNYLNLALFSPGVHSAALRGDLSFNGQLGRNIDYLVDGVSNKVDEWGDASAVGLSLEDIQEFQVITNQYSAEFGHSLGGIVSVVTKNGTNSYHGTGFIYERPGQFDAPNALNGIQAPFNQQQYGGMLGGPIFKDKMHFIGGYEGTRQRTQAVVTSPLAPGNSPEYLNRKEAFGKLDRQLNQNNTAFIRFNYDNSQSLGGIGGLVLPTGGTNALRDGWDMAGTVTSVISPHTVNDGRFLFSKFVNESTNVTNAPESNYIGFAVFGANPGSPQDIRENRVQFNDKLSHDFGSDHRVFFGFDVSRINKTGVFNANSVGVYTFAAGTPFPFDPNNPATFPISFTQGFSDPRRPLSLTRDFPPFKFAGIDRSYWSPDFFVEDSWRIKPSVTVNLGLRYEKQFDVPSDLNFMARTGIAWAPNSKTVIRGGYGRFFDQFFDDPINEADLFGVIGNFSITLTPGGNPTLFPTYPAILPGIPSGFGPQPGRSVDLDLRSVAPNLARTPYSDQYTAGVQRQLSNNMSLSVDYTYLRGQDLFRTVDFNAPSSFDTSTGATRTVAQADATRPFGVPSIVPGPFGLQAGGFKQMLGFVTTGNSWYHGVKVALTKRFSSRFDYQLAYTWSRSRNEQDDFTSLAQGNNTFDFRESFAANDIPHELVMNGTYMLPFHISYSAILQARSGGTVDPLAGADLDGDSTTSDDRAGSLARNSFRMPAFVVLDNTVSKAIILPHEQRITLRFDAFNLFNRENVTGVNNIYGTLFGSPRATFLTPTAVANPRQFQFAVRYSF